MDIFDTISEPKTSGDIFDQIQPDEEDQEKEQAVLDRAAKRATLQSQLEEARNPSIGHRALEALGTVGERIVQPLSDPLGTIEKGIGGIATLTTGTPLEVKPEFRPSVIGKKPAFGEIPQIPQQEGLAAQLGAGAVNWVIDFVNFFQTPEGVATLGIGALPKAAQQQLLKTMGAQMASHAPEQLVSAIDSAKKGDWQGASKQATAGVGGTALSALMLKHGTTKPEIKVTEPTPKTDIEGQPVIDIPAAETPAKVAKEAQTQVTETAVTQGKRTAKEIKEDLIAEIQDRLQKAPGAADAKPGETVTIEIPGDGTFVIPNSAEALSELLTRAKKLDTSSEKKTKISKAAIKQSEVALRETATEQGGFPTVPATEHKVGIPETAPQGEIIGMGGAVPSEFTPQPQTIGIKNARVDMEREARGQPPIFGPQRQSNQATWEQAMAKIDLDPAWQDRLIGELKEKPRTPSALEVTALDHRYVDLKNEYTKAIQEGEQAFKDGRTADIADAKGRAEFWERQLTELEEVARKVGTEWGRSGQMRQRLMKEDFTLAAMESRMRAAKGFEPLTEREHTEIKALHEKLDAAQKAFDDANRKTEQRIAALESQKALAEAKAATQKAYAPEVFAKAERFASFMDKKAEAASARLKARMANVGAGVDPAILSDLSIIGAAKLTRGVVDFAKWTDAMARDVGEWVREHAQEAYAASRKTFEADLNKFGAGDEVTKTTVRKVANDIDARLKKQEAELTRKLETGDITPKPKKQPTRLNAETLRLKARVEILKNDYEKRLNQVKYQQKSTGEKIWGNIKEIANFSRALKTSWDVSAVFRQGGFGSLGNPVRMARDLKPMFEALKDREKAAAVEQEIKSSPNYDLYERYKLFLSPLEGKLTGMEEAFMSRLGEKTPGVAQSQRAYITFLNKFRADTFDSMYEDLTQGAWEQRLFGRKPREAKPGEGEAIANFINVTTGRGAASQKAAAAMEGLAVPFFAPRLVLSRFQTLFGQPLWKGSAQTRYLIAREYAKFLEGLLMVYTLGKMAGGTVEDDPRSADFGKIRFGNTRIDPLTGLSQTAVLTSRLATGETKTGKGKIQTIRGKVPYGGTTTSDVVTRFLRSKFSPWLGASMDIATGQTFDYKPTTVGTVTESLIEPLAFDDILKAMEDQGIERGSALAILSLFGMSLQTYDQKK